MTVRNSASDLRSVTQALAHELIPLSVPSACPHHVHVMEPGLFKPVDLVSAVLSPWP